MRLIFVVFYYPLLLQCTFALLVTLFFFKDIIPKYFTPIIFQSFLRKLYRWGFKRITTTHAGKYKFASANFKRSPPNAAVLNDAAGTTASLSAGQVPFPIAPEMILQGYMRQQSATNVQPSQLYLSLLAQQLLQQQQQQQQQNMQPVFTQDNRLNAALLNAYGQQSLPQVLQLQQQQMIQRQAGTNLQALLAQQQLVNQSMLQARGHDLISQAMGSVCAASSNPLASLNQDQLLQAYAATLTTARPAPEQAMSLLLPSNVQNALTSLVANGASNYQGLDSPATRGNETQDNSMPQRRQDASETQRKRKHPHPPPS